MTQQEILEGNKLIAEFMGATFNEDGTYDEYPNEMRGEVWGNKIDNFLKYHESFDWLMPVVEKIEALEEGCEYFVQIQGYLCCISTMVNHNWPKDKLVLSEVGHPQGKSKLDSTYQAVLQFIKWYNQHK